MTYFFNIFKLLLPKGRAWQIIVDKLLRKFFEGLSAFPDSVKLYFDLIYLDLFPQTTRFLDEWERQWGLQPGNLSEQERRDRLAGVWKALGGQSPRYIQDTLQAAGFPVYVHEWWEPDGAPYPRLDPVVRDPHVVLRDSSTGVFYVVEAGEPLAEAGEPTALAGDTTGPIGYPLVNIITYTEPDYLVLAGEPLAEAGEPTALAGNYTEFIFTRKEYKLPTDPDKYRFFLYIGGETFGEPVTIDPARRDEFEALCQKIKPAQLWLGLIIQYG